MSMVKFEIITYKFIKKITQYIFYIKILCLFEVYNLIIIKMFEVFIT